ncbi:DUF87 domain-containing protein [Oscillatoria sp. FACHB-1406]|uniref:ATP-binding protein n=1 Tax=Oscillatoria sp. FACHB-1406 TaxID=2692846 RepID=UPI0016856F52|nr:DUF87 domain-containing protein [Oscillatoria sp. FACHB-1406]MBD2577681.1 ATP-binding protein [Oscillatoria sp. FACHB-1406]
MSSISSQLTQIDIFKRNQKGENIQWDTGIFVGRPFRLAYSKADILVSDFWKKKASGLPQGCFLLAYYDNKFDGSEEVEAILLRVLRPTTLPTDGEVISSMIEYYKDNIRTGNNERSQLDSYTRYEFSFSGLECSVLGSFYIDNRGVTRFGADLENFYSAHNYSVIKPSTEILRKIVNYRENESQKEVGNIRLGKVRYSSSRRFQQTEEDVPVSVQAPDFAGKRTALFGMTRTGKSNTVKKIIQACVDMSEQAELQLDEDTESPEEVLNPFTENNNPKYPIGQIIFDINGEYANSNLQDRGTAIFDLYQQKTVRYSTVPKNGFLEMKVNFFTEIESGLDIIRTHQEISNDNTRFVVNFRSIDLRKPEDYHSNYSLATRHNRQIAVYSCVLYRAGFIPPADFRVSFTASQDVRDAVRQGVNPSKGMSLEDAANWWESFWEIYAQNSVFQNYREEKGHEWADEDLKALLVMLTRKSRSGGRADCSGFRILNPVKEQHTNTIQKPYDRDILDRLREGKIVIIDLSLGNPLLQAMFSERICKRIFEDALERFTSTQPNNFIQFYFEEAHNLFPKKEGSNLSQIYNRLAKEGAKLNLGLIYATQEVSSISSNILKATQNWFISHLNNEDEIKELRKYYDFSDFTESLIRFSQDTDKGFVRMKTYSNPFVIPVQIDRFPPEN